MDEQNFEALAKSALQLVSEVVESATESAEKNIDVELEDGVLVIEIEENITFLINKHAPLQQLWVSSPISGAGHYAWDESKSLWISTRSNSEFMSTIFKELSEITGTAINYTVGFTID